MHIKTNQLRTVQQDFKTNTLNLTLMVAGSLFIALSARVAVPVPFSMVPVTLQTLAVLIVMALLGSKRGTLSVLLYLSEGLAGLPVFALGAGGFYHLTGPTGGYLLAFLPLGFLFGRWLEWSLERRFLNVWVAGFMTHAAILFIGTLWLSRFVSWEQAMMKGIVPFIPGAVFKSVILAGIINRMSRNRES
ncbi:MAG: biotin transport system substrate-specific component [Candidatus Marinimicrobia bacterium]|nr:biotin transport system substrate-specific component [Candidatus Neomarinimicrobiota bacterium]